MGQESPSQSSEIARCLLATVGEGILFAIIKSIKLITNEIKVNDPDIANTLFFSKNIGSLKI